MGSENLSRRFDETAADPAAGSRPANNSIIPTVVKKGEGAFDLFSATLSKRIIILTGPIDDQVADLINAQLKHLDTEKPGEPITLLIDSPGGSVTAGLSIYDTMRNIRSPVATIGRGICASMGSFLLSAGTPGMRFVTPNAEVMVHQPLIGGLGRTKSSELKQTDRNLEKTRRRLETLYAHFMGVDPASTMYQKLIKKLTHEDTYLNALMAVKLGLVDDIAKPTDFDTNPEKQKEFDVIMKLNQLEIDEIDNGPESEDTMKIVKDLIIQMDRNRNTAAVARPSAPANQP
jgi:ATP-dependent Clp protease, protease subunit